MKIIADTHTHTLMSTHAYSTLIENINEAKKKGLKFIAVTDHTGTMPGSPDNTYFTCMWSGIPDEYEGVYILRGCETNIIDENGNVDVPDGVMDSLEWVIASIHSYLTKPFDFDTHTKIWTNIAKNPHIDVIGHCGEERFSFDYEKVIPIFAEYGKIVEINASSFKTRPTCKDNCMKIARLCTKHNVPLVVSSDAHFASDVGNFDLAIKNLTEAGIPESSMLNADAKRFAEYLTKKTGRQFNL